MLKSLAVKDITLMAPDSSIRSMENSFPEPVDLFHVLTSPLLVTLALIVHLFCNTLNYYSNDQALPGTE